MCGERFHEITPALSVFIKNKSYEKIFYFIDRLSVVGDGFCR